MGFAARGVHLAQGLPQGVIGGRRHDCSRDSMCKSEPEQRQGHPPTRVSLGSERCSVTLGADNLSTPNALSGMWISFSPRLSGVPRAGLAIIQARERAEASFLHDTFGLRSAWVPRHIPLGG